VLIVIDSYSSSNSRLSSMSMGLPAAAHAHTTYPNDIAKSSAYSSNVASTSNIAHYDPYAPPRRPSGSLAAIPSSGPKTPGYKSLYDNECDTDTCIQLFDLKIPLFSQSTKLYLASLSVRVSHALCGLYKCSTIYLESTSATDRRQQSLTFTLTPDQSAKLKVPG
jgi:E3 SUMO-protein ligase PIAS1